MNKVDDTAVVGDASAGDTDVGSGTASTPGGAGGTPGGGEAPDASGAPAGGDAGGGVDRPAGRLAGRLLLGATLAPLVVSAAALVLGVGGDYMPAADYALTEMQVRDVGREPVLVGLFSRDAWNHPGPAMFYLLAPFYRLAGGASIGLHLGALAINGAALAGMAYIARRRGGTPLMLLTVLGAGLLLRSLAADFVHDPWNCFVTVLPYGLLMFLAWAMTCGEAWALPVAAGVATYLAQTHVGFVALGLPLLAWGAAGLVLAARRDAAAAVPAGPAPAVGGGTGDGGGTGGGGGPGEPAAEVPEGRGAPRGTGEPPGVTGGAAGEGHVPARPWAVLRPLRAAGLVTAAVLGVMWLPPLVDVLVNAPSNFREIVDWFGEGDDEVKTIGQGWRVVTGQFGGAPEWLAGKKAPLTGGESPFLTSAPLPWGLAVVALGGAWLWRRGGDGRRLAAVVGITLALSLAAVVRTVGPAFDYRLRWTWVPPMVAAVMAAWAGWRWLVGRRPGAERWLVAGAWAGVVVVTAVNSVTAATAGTPHEGDSAALEGIMPGVLDAVDEAVGDDGGQVVVADVFANGSWYARGVVLQLERAGYDARAPEHYADLFGESRVAEGPAATRLWVGQDEGIAELADQPGLRLVAEWQGVTDEDLDWAEGMWDTLDADLASGELTAREHYYGTNLVGLDLHSRSPATSYAVAVFVDESPSADVPPE